MSQMIIGRNAVSEALKNNREIEKITVAKGADGSMKQIIAKARDKKIPVYFSDKAHMDKQASGGAHQGVIAVISDYSYCTVDDILQRAADRGEASFIIVLDGLEDPHNLGAVMRSAECAGVHGIIIPKRRSVSVTDTVAKTSAGAVEYMLCAKVANIASTIDELKKKGLGVCACEMGGQTYHQQDLTGPIAVVVGGEGSGVSRLVREKCDFVVSIPMKGRITSLNASNAAAILMYEVVRQRS